MKKARFVHVDLLEVLAIFFVIMYHSTVYAVDSLQHGDFVGHMTYFGRTILSTCVPLFFFVNGYLLFNKPLDLKKHVKKIIRIVLLVVGWNFSLMTIYMVISGQSFSVKTIVQSVLNMDVAWSMNFVWFLGALVGLYIFFPAMKALFDTNKKAFIFFVIACALLTFGNVLANQGLKLLDVMFPDVVPIKSLDIPLLKVFDPLRMIPGYSFVYFCVGGLIQSYEGKILSIKKATRNTIAIVGVVAACAGLYGVGVFYTNVSGGVQWDVVWNGYDTIFTFANVVCLYVLSLNFTKENVLVENISCNTLGIFFTHGLFIRLTQPWIMSYGALCNFPANIVYALCILGACLVTCLIFKKIPLLKKVI